MNMEYLCSWLSDCPYIARPVTVDFLEAAPDAVALFLEDTCEVSRRQDVAGNVWVTYRSRFTLLRRVPRLDDGRGYAQWLLDLQAWFVQQSIRGEIIANMRADASDGHLQKDTADGMCVYKVSLDMQYTKTYLAI